MIDKGMRGFITLPTKEKVERKFDNALIMTKEYQEQYTNLVMKHTRVGILLAYIISEMDEKNELISDFGTIAINLNWSKASVARAVKMLKEQYSNLVIISKFHNVSKFSVDKSRCYKSELTDIMER